jgi:hypothetical protein
LIDASKKSNTDERDRVYGGPKSKRKFQLFRERRGVGIVDNLEIGDDAKNALLLFELDLPDRDLFG